MFLRLDLSNYRRTRNFVNSFPQSLPVWLTPLFHHCLHEYSLATPSIMLPTWNQDIHREDIAMRLFACLLLLATISVPSLFAGDGCTYKQPPLFKDQDIHMSDGVCQRCEDGIWVDRYCSVCQQGAHAGTSASAKTNKLSTRTKTSSTGSNACTDGSDSYSNGARKGGPGNRQVCGNGTWTVTEPDTHTVCNAQ
jgi:hypothetical protein